MKEEDCEEFNLSVEDWAEIMEKEASEEAFYKR